MIEAEHGVQERPVQRKRIADAAVRAVADERVADRREVHADLMGPAGLEPALDQRDDRPVAPAAGPGAHDVVRGARRTTF